MSPILKIHRQPEEDHLVSTLSVLINEAIKYVSENVSNVYIVGVVERDQFPKNLHYQECDRNIFDFEYIDNHDDLDGEMHGFTYLHIGNLNFLKIAYTG